MKEFILQLIENKKKHYTSDYSEMLGDYNREKETIQGYDGRQIYELLQNCDDEGAKEVVIELDKSKSTITVSNNGSAFSEKGFRSLFIANLSSKKSKRKFIGNKGLGFRSIISWSDSIEIQSAGVSIKYSEENRQYCFDTLFSREKQEEIRKNEGISKGIIPMPFLCLPVISDGPLSEFTTSILIRYKKSSLKKITEQVKKITPETLLFLKHIERIVFKGFDDRENLFCSKHKIEKTSAFNPVQTISFGKQEWEIFESEGKLPLQYCDDPKGEIEFFQIKIAVDKNFENTSPYLYSFFPTGILLDQPYILHATFDLDPTRNQLTSSEKNVFLLEKIVEFTIKVCKYYSGEKVNYRPLEILTHGHEADSLKQLGYYDLLVEAIENEEIFPCVDNSYRCQKEVIYVNNELAELIIESKMESIFPFHLISIEEDHVKEMVVEVVDGALENYDDIFEIISKIGRGKLTITQRAKWIGQIVENADFINEDLPHELEFIINEKGDLLSGDEYVYTPNKNKRELKTPSYSKIQFINTTLFEKLCTFFDYTNSDEGNKSRFIQEKLSGFFNIHSYGPASLAHKIISEANKQLTLSDVNAISVIKEMHGCLFANYQLMDAESKTNRLTATVPVINLLGDVIEAEKVMLSKYYPTGEITTSIFQDIYIDSDFIASPAELGILSTESDANQIESYILWLGVNKFAKYESQKIKNTNSSYFEFLRKSLGIKNFTSFDLTYKKLSDGKNILSKILLENLILWIYFDVELKTQLSDYHNKDIVRYYYYSFTTPPVKPSYLKYQISETIKYKVSAMLIDEKFLWANDIQINYSNPEFLKNDLRRTHINEILLLLGAQDDFYALKITEVEEIINKLPKFFPEGKKTQSFYKKALGHYKVNHITATRPLQLFADDGNGLKTYTSKKIYFSDKIRLPYQLRNKFPIFNFPSRAGGADAIDFFGINDLKNIHFKVIKQDLLIELTKSFNDFFHQLKPVILTHRINDIDDIDDQKNQAAIINKIEFQLCSYIKFEVDGIEYSANEYEFLNSSNHTYCLSIKQEDSLNTLKRNVQFAEAFADILLSSFDISSEKNTFKNILRSVTQDAIENAKADYGEDIYNEARELLGLADYKESFWMVVFKLKGINKDHSTDTNTLEELIKQYLMIDYDTSSIEYEKLHTPSELGKVRSLFTDLTINLEEFASQYPFKISMASTHAKSIASFILSKKQLIKNVIWQDYLTKGIDEQAQFLNTINKFEDFEQFTQQKALEFEHSFLVNHDKLFEEYFRHIYGNLDLTKQGEAEESLEKNTKVFSKDEIYQINQSARLKSLLYFEEALPQITKDLQQLNSESTLLMPASYENDLKFSPQIISSELLISTEKNQQIRKSKGVFIPNDIPNRILKEKGNTAEEIVLAFMKSQDYNSPYLASRDNEGLHYDIRYTDTMGTIKYVEVKSFDSGSFHLSGAEYEFGKNNEADYEIWLVQNQKNIIRIKDFFTNTKYKTIIADYIVHVELIIH